MGNRTTPRTQPLRIVALGGGTGLSSLLRGLKGHVARRRREGVVRPIADLAAVVTVTDDGGSSGRLRRDYKILPPGDIRRCMVALSKDETLLGRLFQFRFPSRRGELGGHSFGNLFLAALTGVTGDFVEAVRVSGQVLAIRGRIFPATTQLVGLEAELEDGTRVRGETRISRSRKRIRRVRLVPRRAKPLPEVLEALRRADLILLGPGSLYTSIIPNLLVEQVAETLAHARGTRVYIANLMTQPGETQGYSVLDHVSAIFAHTARPVLDCVIVNRAPVSPRLMRRYRAQGATPVDPSIRPLEKMGLRVITGDLVEENGVARHDSDALTRLIRREFFSPAVR